jgi:hypothetical protein
MFQSLISLGAADMQSDEDTDTGSDDDDQPEGTLGDSNGRPKETIIQLARKNANGGKILLVKTLPWRNPEFTALLHFLDIMYECKGRERSSLQFKVASKQSSKFPRVYSSMSSLRKAPSEKPQQCYDPAFLEDIEDRGYLDDLAPVSGYPQKLPGIAYYDGRARQGSATLKNKWSKHREFCLDCI